MSDPGTNTSATGGPMLPVVAPAPLEGVPLLNLFQETFVALTGIASSLVRPRFQAAAPAIPPAGDLWMTFTIERRPSDTFPVIIHDPDQGTGEDGDEIEVDFTIGDSAIASASGANRYQRQEQLVILCSFYDNGATGQAYQAAALLRDGLSIPQNIEALKAGGQIAMGWSGEIQPLPSLLKTLWLYRVDLEIHFNRQIDRIYRTDSLLAAAIDLKANTQGSKILERVITVTNPPTP